jgi:hypothetical protein
VFEDVKFVPHPVDNAEPPRERRHFKVTGVSINAPIPDALFSPTIPPGYTVINSANGGEISIVQPDATTRPMRDAEIHPRRPPAKLERPN